MKIFASQCRERLWPFRRMHDFLQTNLGESVKCCEFAQNFQSISACGGTVITVPYKICFFVKSCGLRRVRNFFDATFPSPFVRIKKKGGIKHD